MSPLELLAQRVKQTPSETELSLPPGFAKETELRFYLPQKLIKKTIADNNFLEIEQRRFPEHMTEALLARFAPKLKGHAELFSFARLRQITFPDGDIRYEIEFKGQKHKVNGARISRPVIEEPIQVFTKEYKELAPLAYEGAELKRRYTIPGHVKLSSGDLVRVEAEVDLYLAFTNNLKPLPEKQRFATVDVELTDTALIRPLLRGHHSFGFLKQCVPMNFEHARISKKLSSGKLGSNGLGEKQLAAIRDLEEIASRI
ncbi:MAG: hypothetical protein ACK5Y6_02680 [Pseudomonadota bacterium]